MFATGKIKRYQIIVTTVGCLVFPLSWISFELGMQPQAGYIIYFIIYTILLGVRLYLLKDMVKLPVMMYVREVLFKVLPVIVISFVILGMVVYLMNPSFIRLLIVCVTSVLTISIVEFFIGLTKQEKAFVLDKIKVVINKI